MYADKSISLLRSCSFPLLTGEVLVLWVVRFSSYNTSSIYSRRAAAAAAAAQWAEKGDDNVKTHLLLLGPLHSAHAAHSLR